MFSLHCHRPFFLAFQFANTFPILHHRFCRKVISLCCWCNEMNYLNILHVLIWNKAQLFTFFWTHNVLTQCVCMCVWYISMATLLIAKRVLSVYSVIYSQQCADTSLLAFIFSCFHFRLQWCSLLSASRLQVCGWWSCQLGLSLFRLSHCWTGRRKRHNDKSTQDSKFI